jgi:Second Messenger Oligonucleotide or Dinucleotide Synthetase domain
MITLEDAFAKFLNRLELKPAEQADVKDRHTRVRQVVKAGIGIERDILSGSYKRRTKTKPLKDVDIFFILQATEADWLDRPAQELLTEIKGLLVPVYGESSVSLGRRSVKVDFGLAVTDDQTDEKVMSIDVVPAFASDEHYVIPDRQLDEWVSTDPEIHEQLATDANAAYGGRWKPLVRMIKKWNDHHERPVKPSFLLEVMALGILNRGFGGHYSLELQTFFATAAERISETWDDPAKLGPPISDRIASEPLQLQTAAKELARAAENVSRARRLAQSGKNGEALRVWRDDIFGPLFPLS